MPLGQIIPPITTATTLYQVATGESVVVSTVFVCNQSTATTFRLAVVPAGQSLATHHYLYFGTAVPANNTVAITSGITLSSGDALIVYAGSASLSFSAFGLRE